MNIIQSLWQKLINIINPSAVMTHIVNDVFATPDKDAPNLFLGKIIDDGSIKCEVVDVHNTNMHVKILEINWPVLGTYLDIGKIYPVYRHRGKYQDTMQMWEISPKRMKRDTSQILLMWQKDSGWSWDIDS